jgi:DNA-binding XRE family transcriptional regulator
VKPPDLALLAETRAQCRSGQARAIRADADLTQLEVASALGVSRAAVSQWERGQRVPSGSVALAYGRLLRQLAKRAA